VLLKHVIVIFVYIYRKTKKVSGYFVVDPTLSLPDEDHLPLDCIALQTYLAKCLGPLSEWEARLRVGYEAGYNMIHLTPVQELGGSNSAYSLHDQLKLNSSFDESDMKYEFDDLKKMIEKLHQQWKMFFICDIVLNHTANCTPWLKDHPESAYNLANSPHLRPAYVVDDALWKFSSDIARGAYDSDGIPVYINHEEQLGVLHRILR
jgi:glycogen debranching enzyme